MSKEIELFSAAAVSSLGKNLEEINLTLRSSNFDGTLSPSSQLLEDGECLVGFAKAELESLPQHLTHLDSHYSRLLQHLYLAISESVNELIKIFGAKRIGIVIGSSTSGVDRAEAPFMELESRGDFPDSYQFFHQELGAGSETLAALSGAKGPCYTISTACSSGAKAFQSGRGLLEMGLCDAVIVGGVDALCKITARGFQSLDLLTGERSMPMSKNRSGLNLGEGGALFVLIKSPKGAQLLGVGESSDAHHIASPDPEGGGAVCAMLKALSDAGRKPEDVSYLNLHGTGTINNDSMESRAVEKVLGLNVPCSSTKPLTGHLLGASGAFEAALCYSLIASKDKTKFLPPHIWDEERDPTLPEIEIVHSGQSISISEQSVILSNSFAFGGSNCCLAFGRGEPC